MPLTPKQNAYLAARIAGSGPSDAYRLAYNASKMSGTTIANEALDLDRHPEIAPMLARAQMRVVAKAIVTKEMVLEGLLELAQGSEVPHNVRRSAWRDLGEHLAMFKLVVNHEKVESLAEEFGLDPAEIAREAEAILKASR